MNTPPGAPRANSRPLQYYPLYVYDFDESQRVLAMNISEVGLYLLALNESWKRGSIPDDPKAVAMLIRKDQRDIRKAWPAVRACFVENGTPGRLVNPRQETERDKALDKSRKATEAVRSRYESSTDVDSSVGSDVDSNAHTQRVPRASDSESKSFSESKILKEKKDDPLRIEFDTLFWPIVWRKTAKEYAFKCYAKQRKTASCEVIVGGVKRDSVKYLERDSEHRPHMSTYLNEQRFNDEPDPEGVAPKSKLERLFDSI